MNFLIFICRDIILTSQSIIIYVLVCYQDLLIFYIPKVENVVPISVFYFVPMCGNLELIPKEYSDP
jgi:hypothetical protein